MICVISNIKAGKTKNGKTYYLFDAFNDGHPKKAKIWDVVESLENGNAIDAISTKEDEYNGEKSLIIKEYNKVEISKEDAKKHLGLPCVDVAKMYKKMLEIIDKNLTGTYKDVCNLVYRDSKYSEALKSGFGACRVHHNYEGGLLEHTYEVVKICMSIVPDIYPELNRELLIAGALLHDIGKIFSYKNNGLVGEYTFDGYMEDHLYIGCEMINSVVDAKLQNRKDVVILKHMVLSHHGQRDWGSPVVPMVPEAMLLHFADNISAKIKIFEGVKKSAPTEGKEFSDFVKHLDSCIYLGELKWKNRRKLFKISKKLVTK